MPTHRVSSEGCLCAARLASLWGSAPMYTTPLYTNGLGGSQTQKCDQKALFISIQNKFKWCFFLRLKIHFLQCFQSLSFSVKNVRCVNTGFWNVSQLATSHKVNWKYFPFCFFLLHKMTSHLSEHLAVPISGSQSLWLTFFMPITKDLQFMQPKNLPSCLK